MRLNYLIIILLFFFAGCEKTPDEVLLRQNITDMQTALEQRQAGDFLQHVAEDYQDNYGQDIKSLKRLLLANFIRHSNINTFINNIEVTISGGTATITFTATLTGGQGLIPDSGRIYTVITKWRKQSSDWLLFSARWEAKLSS
ncbi:MAG: hypothetical protein BMS9Abin26_2090 [Gammaproteobacteria bacterium]|nr:MAG: hypothetical protein BMS9Abin26_2090 [Gammaproteobacteria bacterium]